MNRIEKKFRGLKESGKKAFIAFITAGYPNLSATEKLIREFDKIGIDIIELGVPFSDPMADGPVIQESSFEALKKGVHLTDILNLVKRVRKGVSIPICLMTYYNPVFCYGEKKFVEAALRSGVDGIIVPDLPPEEGRQLINLANKKGLDVIFFIAPTTSRERMKYIAKMSRGFIYYVSLTGVTGARKTLASDLIRNLKAAKSITTKPLCVGFGVSSRQQIRQIQRFCDGVIVGSAIIKNIRDNLGRPDMVKRAGNFVRTLKG